MSAARKHTPCETALPPTDPSALSHIPVAVRVGLLTLALLMILPTDNLLAGKQTSFFKECGAEARVRQQSPANSVGEAGFPGLLPIALAGANGKLVQRTNREERMQHGGPREGANDFAIEQR